MVYDLEVIHNCGQKATTQQSNEVAEINEDMKHSPACDNIAKKANELFYDYIKCHPNEAQQLQRIRNTQTKHQKSTICGYILTCFECQTMLSKDEVVNMSLAQHRQQNTNTIVTLPIHDKQMDLAAYRYPYD